MTDKKQTVSAAYNQSNAEYDDFRQELKYFTSLSSDTYCDLNKQYENVFDDWVIQKE
jgi:hypothetical protein